MREFVQKYLNSFNDEQLKQLEKFLEFEDEIIYNFYNFDKVKKDIDTITQPKAFPDYLRSGSPLRTIKKISQLAWDHPAKKYVLDRKIPNESHSKLYYCPRFYSWTNTLIPNKFKDTIKDEPRLIIPFIDENCLEMRRGDYKRFLNLIKEVI